MLGSMYSIEPFAVNEDGDHVTGDGIEPSGFTLWLVPDDADPVNPLFDQNGELHGQEVHCGDFPTRDAALEEIGRMTRT